jgi:hypothetical protein
VSSKLQWYPNVRAVDANRVAGWLNTMLFTERATRDYRRAFVRFEDLLDDWTQQIAHVSARFEIPSLVNAQARAQATAGSLVDPSLRRSTANWEDLEDVPKGLIYLCERAWNDLLFLSGTEARDVTETLASLEGHREEYVTLYHHAEQVAQSSIIAATRQATREAAVKAPAAQPQGSPADFLLGQVRRRIPAGVRGMIPLRVKLALVNLFK